MMAVFHAINLFQEAECLCGWGAASPCSHLPCNMHLSKFTLTLLLFGISGILVGFTFKLNHLMGAEPIFNAGVFAAVLGLWLAVRDIWKRRKA